MDFSEVKFTHIIVGAGSTGAFWPTDYLRRSQTVLLLEAGDWDRGFNEKPVGYYKQ